MVENEDVRDVQVLIIGAGLAGLSAALAFEDANATQPPEKKIRYALLDGKDRVGGRTLTLPGQQDMDFGGGYVGVSQNYLQFLLRRYGIRTIEEFLPRDKQWLFEYSDGIRVEPLPGDDPLSLPGRLNAALRLGELDAMSLEVRSVLNTPERSNFANLDQISVQEYIEQQAQAWEEGGRRDEFGMNPDTIDAFVCSVRSAFSVEPAELSMFYLLYYAAAAGSYSALVDVAGGPGAAEGARLPNGTGELVGRMLADIQAGSPGALYQNTAVYTVKQDGG
ncbi:MAG TPA: FAD-dependent oxidoreductase, partial [Burkholderiales bacterium]|nr:FAD-dependent oxidoreductase [Burkholderiales bacterium]